LPLGEGDLAAHCLFLPLEALTVPGRPGQVALSFRQALQDLIYPNIKNADLKLSGQLTKGLAAASVH